MHTEGQPAGLVGANEDTDAPAGMGWPRVERALRVTGGNFLSALEHGDSIRSVF